MKMKSSSSVAATVSQKHLDRKGGIVRLQRPRSPCDAENHNHQSGVSASGSVKSKKKRSLFDEEVKADGCRRGETEVAVMTVTAKVEAVEVGEGEEVEAVGVAVAEERKPHGCHHLVGNERLTEKKSSFGKTFASPLGKTSSTESVRLIAKRSQFVNETAVCLLLHAEEVSSPGHMKSLYSAAKDRHPLHLPLRSKGNRLSSDVANDHLLLLRLHHQESKSRSSSDAASGPSLLLLGSVISKRKKSSSDDESESHPGSPHQNLSQSRNLLGISLLRRFHQSIVLQSYKRSSPITDTLTMVSKEHDHQHLHRLPLQVHLRPCHKHVRKTWRSRSGDVVSAMVKTFMKRMSYTSEIGKYARPPPPRHRLFPHLNFAKNLISKSLVAVQRQRTKAVKETIGETLDVSFVVTCGPSSQKI